MASNIEKIISSLKEYIGDQLEDFDKSHEHIEYVKRNELSRVAFSGEHIDINNPPEIPSIEGLASIEYVDEAISKVPGGGGNVEVKYDEETGNLIIGNVK